MATRTGIGDPELSAYALAVGCRESDALRALREETAALEMARMQISPIQGAFLAMLTRLTGARRCLEIGVFTGYSALAVAEALPVDGRILACDIHPEWTRIAQRHWTAAGLADRIDLRLAPALETLDALLAAGETAAFDLAFIDADKSNMEPYYERCLQLVRPGGLIAVDNVLWSGAVIDPDDSSVSTTAIKAFNAARANDDRADLSLVPIGDGVTLLRVRG